MSSLIGTYTCVSDLLPGLESSIFITNGERERGRVRERERERNREGGREREEGREGGRERGRGGEGGREGGREVGRREGGDLFCRHIHVV